MTARQLFRLVVWPGSFVTEWPEMPREVFRSMAEAHAAAREFVARWDAGGYEPMTDVYWARETVGDNFRLTQFVVD